MLKAWMTIAVLGSTAAWTQTLDITARVHNQAHVPQNLLISAEREASYVLRTAAVQVRWVDCAVPGVCDGVADHDEFEILVREDGVARASDGRQPEAMGQALLPVDQSGCYALAYYNQIRRIAENTAVISAGELLGYVIAHEIGHLVLGPHHEEGTVMQGHWAKREFEMMAQRKLRFNASQRLVRSQQTVAQNRSRGDQALLAAVLNADR